MKLDARLAAVASLVKQGSTLIDVGTDHAYLPCFLVQTGVCPRAVAADLRTGPLENARATIAACGLESKIETRLSNGLDAFTPQKGCTVVLAGMGGLLIAELLARTPWVFDQSVQLVAQPMSHAEDVRAFFFENGFQIDREVCAEDGRHCYCALAAHYSGKNTPLTPALPYGGLLFQSDDEAAKRFLSAQRARLAKRRAALAAAGSDPEEVERLTAVLADFDRLMELRNSE